MSMIKLLFGFRGRISRPLYWAGGVPVLVVSFAAYMARLAPTLSPGPASDIAASLAMPVLAICFWCGAALNIKRLHDRGRSFWYALVLLAPLLAIGNYITGAVTPGAELASILATVNLVCMVAGIFCVIDLGCLDGQPGPNRFGYPPGTTPPADAPPEPDEILVVLLKTAMARFTEALGHVQAAAGGVKTAMPAKQAVVIPCVTARPAPPPSFANVEAALDQAIAAHTQAPQQAAQSTPRQLQTGGLKSSPASSTPPSNAPAFGRRTR